MTAMRPRPYTVEENRAERRQLVRLRRRGAERWTLSRLQDVAIHSGPGQRGHALWRAAHTLIRARRRQNAAVYRARRGR